jgi:hypothetical protein
VKRTHFVRTTKKCYYPHEAVTAYLEKELLLAKRRMNLIPAGEKKTVNEAEEINRRYLDKQKNDVLNGYIFPSMANIVTFLEYSRKEELKGKFDEDVKQLLFGISGPKESPRSVYERFMWATVSWSPEKEDFEEYSRNRSGTERLDKITLTDFHLDLFYSAYKMIRDIMMTGTRYIIDDDSFSQNVVIPDLARLELWTRLLAKDAGIDFNHKNRPVLF